MSYKRRNKSVALWLTDIGLLGMMVFGLLASVAQADTQTDVRYTLNQPVPCLTATATSTPHDFPTPLTPYPTQTPFPGVTTCPTNIPTNTHTPTMEVCNTPSPFGPKPGDCTPTPSPTPTYTPVTPTPSGYSISGKVTDSKGNGVPFARITTNVGEYLTKSDGTYSIPGLSAGTYQITVTSTTMVFTPTVRAVVVPPNNTEASFTQLCVSPNTGLNVCTLEVGDILLYSHREYPQSIIAKTLVGTYWFHTALFAGDNYIVHSQGPQQTKRMMLYTSLQSIPTSGRVLLKKALIMLCYVLMRQPNKSKRPSTMPSAKQMTLR